ncbi:hypothetical protein INS49_013956 [Diaporthe citri]|uniref:uncharacterized protein n=1 Tax=Diaporthe citri TaxID=83186 RepID=UPI001C7E9DB7|nr:uncharacterized protein INS49_013956 [Diaporthe citri]KAG6358072.1 hypothetical protein INS49_013956 [Diaporthe citri]
MLLKVAILIDWAHLFNPLKKRNAMFWAIRILLVANMVHYITATFLEAFRCGPQRRLWDVFYKGGYCPINVVVLNLVASSVNVVSDVAILVLPQWVIWRLNMTRSAKAGVSVLFLIGIFAVVCAFCRVVWLTKLLDSKDEIYLAPITGAFAMGEMTAAFLIIGVPSVPRVFRTLFSQGSSVRSLMSRIRLLSWTGRRRISEGPDGGSGGTLGRPSWHNPAHHTPRGLWEFSDNDTFDLLSVSTAHVEADRHPAYDVNFPQNSIKRDMRVDVVNERIG